MSSSAPALSVRGLGKSYTIVHNATGHVTMAEVALHRLRHPFQRAEREQFWALRDVDFDLHEGEVLGVLGRNGAGKSTLLKLLGRIAAPTAGEIALWGRVGSLLEVGTGFHPELTGRENVYLNGSILGMTTREIARQFDAIVDFAGVERFLDTPVKRYSSGMYVRLAFAVAAHLETEILLVDEVLAVGDADFQRKCLDKMHDVASTGRTVVFVSHQMRSIERLCSRVLLLEGGRIAFDGSTAEGVSRYLHQSFEDVGQSIPEDRPGTGEIRVTDVSVPTQNLAAEDPKRIQFRLEQRREGLDRCFVAVVVRNGEGIPVAHCDSSVVGEWYSVADGAAEGEFTLATPWLHPGDYVVDLYVCNAGVLDSYDNACRFTVRPGYPYAVGIDDELARRDLVPPDFRFGTLTRAARAASHPESAADA
jgi:lipopolysaccharide transport system ATP-binding protein